MWLPGSATGGRGVGVPSPPAPTSPASRPGEVAGRSCGQAHRACVGNLHALRGTAIVLLGRVVAPPPIHPVRVEITPSGTASGCCMIRAQPPASTAVEAWPPISVPLRIGETCTLPLGVRPDQSSVHGSLASQFHAGATSRHRCLHGQNAGASDSRISPEIAPDSGTWGRSVLLPEMVGTDLELVAERIAVPAAGLRRRFNRFPGIGQKTAAMVVES